MYLWIAVNMHKGTDWAESWKEHEGPCQVDTEDFHLV